MRKVEAESASKRHTRLLLSIPNVAAHPQPSCLLCLDPATQSKEWVEVGYGDLLVSGAGIYADDRCIYHLCIARADFRTVLTVLDRDTLEVLHTQELPETDDGHSLQRIGQELVVVSTGTDQVLAYPIDGFVVGPPREVWSPTGSGTDTHHVNSVAYANGHLYCSAFGPRDEGAASWSSARNGYIRDVTAGVTVLGGLRQPHSAVWHDGQLFLCNSQEGSVNVRGDVIAYLSGYSRGLTFGPDGLLYVGTSLARKPAVVTGDTGVFLNPTGEGPLHGQCAVIKMTLRGTNRVEIAIPPFGNEIYDLIVL